MPITHLMSEICNLAYLIVENIVEEQYVRHRRDANGNRRRKSPHRSYRPRHDYKSVTRPPNPEQRP